MKKWIKRLLILVAIIVVVFVLKATVFKAKPLEVEVTAVEHGKVEETVTNSRAGTVKVRRRANLSPEIGGQVVAIPYREGDHVEQGEVLLQIEDSLQRARLALSERELEAVEADRQRACLEAERASRELERTRRLAGEEIISEDVLDEVDSLKRSADAACTAATASVARAKAGVQLAQTELDKAVIRAPFAGIVAEVTTEVGEWTTPSPPALPVPPVLDLLDPSSTYISAPMDEVDSARISQGLPARITVDSHRDRHFPGRISRVAPYVLDLEEQNRTVEIEVELDPPPDGIAFLAGTSADVEIILSDREDVLRIPTAAVMEGNRVLVLDSGILEERHLEVGLRNWDFCEVTAGLEEGDLVVTSLDLPEIQAGAEAVQAETETR